MRDMSLSVTKIEHHKIEPITKHLFPLQDERSCWPEKNIIEEYEAITNKNGYNFIDLIVNSQFILSQQTHRKIMSYIKWISKRPLY